MVIAASMSNRESESFLMAWQYVVCVDPFVGLAGGL
jgi:hypothetical protein